MVPLTEDEAQQSKLCAARAAAKYVARMREPEGMKARLGTRGHAIAADYLSKGTPPNRAETFEIPKTRGKDKGKPTVFYPGRMVWNIMRHLPPAGTVPNVERKISLMWRGITFHPQSSIDWETNDGPGDHKFTTSLEYAKAPEQLRTDEQVTVYSADWFQRHDADAAVFQHTYGQFDCKDSAKILTPVTRISVARVMDDVIIPKAEELLGWVAKNVDWRTLPKNTNACGKFPPDGCPYARECPRTGAERRQMIRASIGLSTTEKRKDLIGMSDFMAKIRAKREAAKAAAANTNAAPVSETKTPIADSTPETPSADIEQNEEEAVAALAGHINPPGEAADVSEPEEGESDGDVPPEHEATALIEKPKSKRGRPAGSKTKPKGPDAAIQTTLEKQLKASVETTNEAHEQVTEAEAAEAETAYQQLAANDGKKPITLLLVDCFVARSAGLLNDTIHASDLIEQAHTYIKQTYAVLDYRAGGAPELEYGKGPGLLAACIEGLIQDLPCGCVVLLDTRSPEGQVALQPLVAASISVVRGAA